MTQPLRARLKTGFLYGTVLASIFSIYVSVMRLFFGSDYGKRTGFALPGTILAYFAAGMIGGLSAAALWPMAKGLIGRLILGFLVMCPVMAIFGLPLLDPTRPGHSSGIQLR